MGIVHGTVGNDGVRRDRSRRPKNDGNTGGRREPVIECPRCHGEGRYYINPPGEWDTCWQCGGKGKIMDEEERKRHDMKKGYEKIALKIVSELKDADYSSERFRREIRELQCVIKDLNGNYYQLSILGRILDLSTTGE